MRGYVRAVDWDKRMSISVEGRTIHAIQRVERSLQQRLTEYALSNAAPTRCMEKMG